MRVQFLRCFSESVPCNPSCLSALKMGCIQSKERIDFEETKALLLHNLAEAEKEIEARETSPPDKGEKKRPQNKDATTK